MDRHPDNTCRWTQGAAHCCRSSQSGKCDCPQPVQATGTCSFQRKKFSRNWLRLDSFCKTRCTFMYFCRYAKSCMRWLSSALAIILSALIAVLRPLLGQDGGCRFEVTCTEYALQQLQTEPLYKAIKNITRRVLSCHPFGRRPHE